MVQMAKIGNVVLGIGVVGLAALVIAERGPAQQRVAEAQARPSAEAVERMPELVLTGRGAGSGASTPASPALASALEAAAARDARDAGGATPGDATAQGGAAATGATDSTGALGATGSLASREPGAGSDPGTTQGATGASVATADAVGAAAGDAGNGAPSTSSADASKGSSAAGADGATSQGSAGARVATTESPAPLPAPGARRSIVMTGPSASASPAALEAAADAAGAAIGDVGEPEPATEEELGCDAPEDGAELNRQAAARSGAGAAKGAASAAKDGSAGAAEPGTGAPLGVLTKEQAQALIAKIPAARVTKHVVKAGDTLIALAKANKCSVGLIRRLNRLKDDTIRLGATLAIPQGPFHAAVDRAGYRITITLDGTPVQSYAVGLGRDGSTPAGEFDVRSRVEKPDWTSPEGDYFAAGDPANPLGTRWLGFGEGGYGIHGTTDPTSIGRQASRGCVRLNAGDIEEVYDFLTLGSRVVIK